MPPEPKSLDIPVTHHLDISQNAPPILRGHLNLGGKNPQGQSIEVTSYYLLKNDTPVIPVMGEFHFSRYAHPYWEEELLKLKAGGVNIIATYVFWIYIEEDEGVFDWSGNNNLRRFVELCAKHDLQIVVRIGPFAHGECRNGGIPDWLYGRPFEVRSSNPQYLAYVERLYAAIYDQVSGLLYKDGGPIIGVQLENEYMHAGAPWEVTFRQGTEWVPAGNEGAAHMQALKTLALAAGFDVPLYLCTGWLNSPVLDGEYLPMQGGYAFTPWSPDPDYRQSPTREFLFTNRHLHPVRNGDATYDAQRYPYVCCEIGAGIQDTYFHRNIVPPESAEAMAVLNLAGGANLIGYYMVHGGSHPTGKHSSMNEFTVPRISYDFQAPLREFGQVADSYRYLRILHQFLAEFGALLAPMTVALPDDAPSITPENTASLRWAARSNDGAGFLFLNNYQDHVEMPRRDDLRLRIESAHATVSLPHTRPLTLEPDVTAILPFGLNLHGIGLTYATTQLLTKIERDDTVLYVFFAPRGMVSEYAFDPTTYRSIEVRYGDVLENGGLCYAAVLPGVECLLSLTTLDGKTVQILTLTRRQAEFTSKQTLWGAERLVISEATLVTDHADVYFYSTGKTELSFLVYPAPAAELNAPDGKFIASTEGMFRRYSLPLSTHLPALQVEMINQGKAVVRFPPDSLEGVSSVTLRIDYVGDIGNAFIDGKLVHDNFYNGTVWEIGLKHFAEALAGKELLLMITPIRERSGGLHHLPTGMAFKPESDGAGVALIKSITAVVEVKTRVWANPTP